MTKDKALTLALEALERYQVKRQDFERFADVIAAIKEALTPMSTTCEVQPEQEPVAITIQQAYDMGAKGAEPTDEERQLFEAWMRGHCWVVVGKWNGKGYVDESEKDGWPHPPAVRTRQLWAAWRDRAALTSPPQRKPLTDDWIRERCPQTWVFETAKQWIRLAEAAHDIKEQP